MESVAVMRRAQSTLSHEVARAMGIADVLDDDADRLAASLGGQREMGADLETARAATARIKVRVTERVGVSWTWVVGGGW